MIDLLFFLRYNMNMEKDDILTEKEYLFIRAIIEKPEEPKWKLYMDLFGCSEQSAKTNASRFIKRPSVKRKIDKLRVIRSQNLEQSTFWDKNRLIYEYTALALRAVDDGHPIFNMGVEVGSKPDYGTAKGCYDSISKIIGAFEVDNSQKKNETHINLGDYFNKKELD